MSNHANAKKPLSVSMTAQSRLSGWESFWYCIISIMTLGAFYFTKILIKRATLEAMIAHDRIIQPGFPYPMPGNPVGVAPVPGSPRGSVPSAKQDEWWTAIPAVKHD
jgi:hypothetical protein